ncbi:hypothetical protein PV10_02389 [Exophiala mesophila]|uniref:Uncharacterized protein n=1 Tax=Exophiala mesophila TaxID=212818 RepID=A0A0D1Y263_EXOME|nr:uncharacterized protein PV10_02389 [Exophiala mesophila]KIV94641.1 hypothetical protein PV10_02389 [Exophiala mesophila]
MLAQTASIAVILAAALPAVSAKASPDSFDVQPDFGFCVPTLKYEGGLGGRADDDFAYLAVDPVITQDGKESTNPSVIISHICDQLDDSCEANDAAKTLCREAQIQMDAVETDGQATADMWNELINGGSQVASELKRRSERRPAKRQIQFIPCSAQRWVENCTGWPRKRGELEPVQEAQPVKRAEFVKPAPVKRSEPAQGKKEKRQRTFIPCSTQRWVENCTGWP